MKYSYSSNGEDFTGMCDSIEEALSEALDNDEEAEVLYIGEANQKTIGEYLWSSDVERLLEQLSEQAGEECGECAEDWLHGPYFQHAIAGSQKMTRVKGGCIKMMYLRVILMQMMNIHCLTLKKYLPMQSGLRQSCIGWIGVMPDISE